MSLLLRFVYAYILWCTFSTLVDLFFLLNFGRCTAVRKLSSCVDLVFAEGFFEFFFAVIRRDCVNAPVAVFRVSLLGFWDTSSFGECLFVVFLRGFSGVACLGRL